MSIPRVKVGGQKESTMCALGAITNPALDLFSLSESQSTGPKCHNLGPLGSCCWCGVMIAVRISNAKKWLCV
jgi:hypothetical protein